MEFNLHYTAAQTPLAEMNQSATLVHYLKPQQRYLNGTSTCACAHATSPATGPVRRSEAIQTGTYRS
jgi:hypothetical protein